MILYLLLLLLQEEEFNYPLYPNWPVPAFQAPIVPCAVDSYLFLLPFPLGYLVEKKD